MLNKLHGVSPAALFASPILRLFVFGALGLLWVYWPTLAELAGRWGSESQYSHGYLVPLFALYLLWARRGLISERRSPEPAWWGLVLLLGALGLRFAGVYLYFEWLAAVSLLPCLAGLALLSGGRPALRWCWPAVAFLVFMIPLPHRLEVALAHPLQRLATVVSTYALELLGFVAYAEGNVIRLGEVRLGVVEACSGLSMLLNFFALATAVVLLRPRPPLERGVIVLSAVPIALFANVLRILATAVLHKTAGGELADLVFHDLAGWLMMPLALGLLWAELRLLSWVLVPAPAHDLGPQALDWWGLSRPGTAARLGQAKVKAAG
jgi:exosortase